MSEWIDCKTRVPESNLPCLVTYREWDIFKHRYSNEREIRILSYMPECKMWNIKSPIKVEAWMPLPKPYEEKEVIN